MKALDLSFGLGAIRMTELGPDAVVAGEVQESGIEAMLAVAVGVPPQYDGFRVVAQQCQCRAAKVSERVFEATDQGFDALVVGELRVAVARIAETRGEGHQLRWTAPQHHEIDLALFAGLRLEAHDRLGLHLWLEG
jgi:hypothetical protein